MCHRLSSMEGGLIMRAASLRVGVCGSRKSPSNLFATALAASRPLTPAPLPPHQVLGLSSQAAQKVDGTGKKQRQERTEEQKQKIAEHKAARQEYSRQMTALRREIQQETKERRHVEAVNAALERRRIAKRQAAAAAVRREKAAVNMALYAKKQAKQKERYEAGFREAARIQVEREERKKNIHGILLEELEEESKHWINTAEDVMDKITDDLWETPGNDTTNRQLRMPGEDFWRFAADVGLYGQEEEPSERNAHLRGKMYSRMGDMKYAETYLRDRSKRWENDTRGLLKNADRLLRKRSPAPPGYMVKLEQARVELQRQMAEDETKEEYIMQEASAGGDGGDERKGSKRA